MVSPHFGQDPICGFSSLNERSCQGLTRQASWDNLLVLPMTQQASPYAMIGGVCLELLACQVLSDTCIPSPVPPLLDLQKSSAVMSPEMSLSGRSRNLEDNFPALTQYSDLFDSKEFLSIPCQAPLVHETTRAFV